jgi:hypothetical protein
MAVPGREAAPKCWVFAYPFDALEVSIAEGVLGSTERFRPSMGTMRPGDLAIVYVTRARSDFEGKAKRISSFRALFEITGPSFKGDTLIWPIRTKLYPVRVPARLLARLDVPIASVLWDLAFITNKLPYGLAFLNSPRAVPLSDIRRILAANVPPLSLPERQAAGQS